MGYRKGEPVNEFEDVVDLAVVGRVLGEQGTTHIPIQAIDIKQNQVAPKLVNRIEPFRPLRIKPRLASWRFSVPPLRP